MQIAVDTREQRPYTFEGYPAIAAPVKLTSGDYSLVGFEADIAIERKAAGDLIGCLTGERERFFRELERLRGYQAAALVVEAPYSAIAGGEYRSKMNPGAAVQSLIAIMQRYRMPVFFAESREQGEFFTYHFLRHFCRLNWNKYRAMSMQKTVHDSAKDLMTPDYKEQRDGDE